MYSCVIFTLLFFLIILQHPVIGKQYLSLLRSHPGSREFSICFLIPFWGCYLALKFLTYRGNYLRFLFITPLCLFFLLISVLPVFSLAFHGYYEMDRHFTRVEEKKIRSDESKIYFQGRFEGAPLPHADYNLQTSYLHETGYTRELQLDRGHIRFYNNFSDNAGFEAYIFSHEDERLNLTEPLFDITGYRSSVRGNRINGWYGNSWFNLVHGKFDSDAGDNADREIFAFRFGHNLFDNALQLSLMGNRLMLKPDGPAHNSTLSGGLSYNLFGGRIAAQLATSRLSVDWSDNPNEKNLAFEGTFENMSIPLGPLGGLNFTSKYRNYHRDYENYLGMNPANEVGVYTELNYLIPGYQVDVSLLGDYKEVKENNEIYRTPWGKIEVKIGFVRSFTVRLSYDNYEDPYKNDRRHPNLQVELESLSRYNSFTGRLRLADIDLKKEKRIMEIENTTNFTEDLTGYIKGTRSWQTYHQKSSSAVKGSLRYRLVSNGEVSVDYQLQEDGSDRLGALLKTWW